MLWKFAEYGPEEARANKQRLIEKIDDFWRQFSTDADALAAMFRNRDSQQLVDWMQRYLHGLEPNLQWDIGLASYEDKSILEFAVSPETNHDLRPFAETIIDRAPPMQGWKFSPYKTAMVVSPSGVSHTMVSGDWTDCEVLAERDDGNVVNVYFRSNRFRQTAQDKDMGEAYLLSVAVLGEETFEHWFGGIQTEPLSKERHAGIFGRSKREKDTRPFVPLNNLRECFDQQIQSICDSLPSEPFWKQTFSEVTVLQTEGNVAKAGRLIFRSVLPEVVLAKLNRHVFSSRGFSKFGEVFCYIKIAVDEPFPDEIDKFYLMEDELDKALRAAEAGCVIGGGAGPGAMFVDLALADLTKAIEILRNSAASLAIPKKSGLLFLDSHWVDEWVGTFENSPKPERNPGGW